MTTTIHEPPAGLIEMLLSVMAAASQRGGLLEEDTPLARLTAEFFAHNWEQARDGLLARTRVIRVKPEAVAAPRFFEFSIDRPYRRQVPGQAAVSLAAGPIEGIVYYREDLFVPGDEEVPTVAVVLHDRALVHPNFSRRHGLLCLGAWGAESGGLAGPVPLSRLLEHVYRILSYGNLSLFHPADVEAARYFATEPTAFDGLRPVPPLY